MKPKFNFWRSGQCRYIGLTQTLRAEITRDAFGKRHLEITHRNQTAPRNCVKPSTVILFETSAVSVQSCKQRANEFLREAC